MPIIRMRPRERTKSCSWSWPAGVAGTRISPSPAPVAAFRTATWWVSLWVSTPATTQGSSSDRSRVRVPAVSVIMMMRLPRGGRAGRGRADRTLTGLSKLVSGHAGPRPAPVGRRPAGTRTDHDQGRPPGPPVELRVTRPRRTGTYILHVQICCKGAPRPDRPREEPRNINDPPPALRLDPGLCNRFGQRSPSGAPEAGSVGPIRPTTTAAHPPPTLPSVPDRTRTAPDDSAPPLVRVALRPNP